MAFLLGAEELIELTLLESATTELEASLIGATTAETEFTAIAGDASTVINTGEDFLGIAENYGGSVEAASNAQIGNILQSTNVGEDVIGGVAAEPYVNDFEIPDAIDSYTELPDELPNEFTFDLTDPDITQINQRVLLPNYSTPVSNRGPITGIRQYNIQNRIFERDFFDNSLATRSLRDISNVRRGRFVIEDVAPSPISRSQTFPNRSIGIPSTSTEDTYASLEATVGSTDRTLGSLSTSSQIGRNEAFTSVLPIEEPGIDSFIQNVILNVAKRIPMPIIDGAWRIAGARHIFTLGTIDVTARTIAFHVQSLLSLMGVPSQAGYLGLLSIWLAGIIYLAYQDTVPLEAMKSNFFENMQLLKHYVPYIEYLLSSRKFDSSNDIFGLVADLDRHIINGVYSHKLGKPNGLENNLLNNAQNSTDMIFNMEHSNDTSSYFLKQTSLNTINCNLSNNVVNAMVA